MLTDKQALVSFGKGAAPSDVYRNPVLENVSVAAFQDPSMFVARAVFPTIPSPDEQFKYYTFNMDTIGQDKARLRAPGTETEEGVFDASTATVLCEQYGYKEKVPEELAQSAGPAADMETAASQSVAEVLMINAERRFATNFFVTGKWARDMIGQATADATHYIFWNSATSTPIDDVYTERGKILLAGKRLPNTMILGYTVAQRLLTNSQIINRINNGTRPGKIAMASLEDLAVLFGVERVLIAQGVYNSAKEGATASPAFCLDDKSAWLGYVNPKPSRMTPSAGYRGTWAGLAGNDEGIRTWRYFWMPKHSMYVESIVNDVFVMVNNKLGTFFSAIVQ
jgi:hypothetical protein